MVLVFQSACAAPGGASAEGDVSAESGTGAGTVPDLTPSASLEGGSTGALWTESLDAALFEASEPPRRRVVVERQADTPTPEGGVSPSPSVEALVGSALECLTAGDLEGAAADLEEAFGAANGPTRTLVGRALADAWLGLWRHAAAAELYETLLSEPARLPGPDGEAFVRANLAVAYFRLGRDVEARHEIDQALKLRPEHADALKTLGLISQRAGRHADAEVWFENALRIDPDLPEARLALAERAEAQGKSAFALAHYRFLLTAYEREKDRDFHRRWRNLFLPTETTTGEELRGRVARLRAKLSE